MKSPFALILRVGLTASVATLCLATTACSATKDELTKQIDEVKREMTTLRAENAALKDRLDLLETEPKTESVAASEPKSQASGDRPKLEVVHLTPEEPPESPPPVIVAPPDDGPPMDIVGDAKGVKEVDPEAAEPKAKVTKWRPAKQRRPQKRGKR
jgi:hypothetical protein